MTIDPRVLRYLRAIVEAGTYSEAAERLSVTQPMLSKSVKQLEHRHGVMVLTRGRYGAVPTVFGSKLVAWSKIIDAELSKVLEDLDDIKGAKVGHVRVGSVPPLTTRLFPQVISRMKAQHPGVLITLTEQSSRPLTESLMAGDYDLVVGGLGLDPVPPNIVEEFLFSSATMAFVGRKHPLAKQRIVSLKDFHPYPWASPLRSSLASTELLSLFNAAGIHPFDIGVETDSFPTLRAVLQDGRHFVLNTPEVFAEDVRMGRVIALPIREKATVWRFGLKWRRDAFETPAMRFFAEFVRQVVREQPAKNGLFHNR